MAQPQAFFDSIVAQPATVIEKEGGRAKTKKGKWGTQAGRTKRQRTRIGEREKEAGQNTCAWHIKSVTLLRDNKSSKGNEKPENQGLGGARNL